MKPDKPANHYYDGATMHRLPSTLLNHVAS
jgi:hypothetical protein